MIDSIRDGLLFVIAKSDCDFNCLGHCSIFCTVPEIEPVAAVEILELQAANFLCQEQVSLGEGYLKRPFVVRDGYLELPTGPGLGIELDWDFIENCTLKVYS